jgi:hypothetical protein
VDERVRRYVVDEHEDLQELLTRLNNVRDSMEAALGYVRGIEDDYRRGLLEAHIKGAIREINEQITELVSSRQKMAERSGEARRPGGKGCSEIGRGNVSRGDVPQA